MVTTKQKPTVDTQNIKRRESNYSTMENHQFIKEDSRKELGTIDPKQLENMKKMALVSL